MHGKISLEESFNSCVETSVFVKVSGVNNLMPMSGIVRNSSTTTGRYLKPQMPDTFEKTTNPIEYDKGFFIPTASKFNTAIDALNLMNTKAQTAFDRQKAYDGWSGKLADKLSALWGSKNRASLVSDDLHMHKAQVENLENAARVGNFKSEFYKTFGVGYNEEAINKFETASAKYTLIKSAEQIADYTEKCLSEHVNFFDKHKNSINPENPNFDEYGKHANIDKKFGEFKEELTKIIGGKENLKELELAKRPDFITLSKEEQIDVYKDIAQTLIYTTNATAEKLKNGKSDKEIQKDYDEAYKAAYGDKNNIQKRVDKYIKTQQIRSTALKDVMMSGIIGATIALTKTSTPALVGSAVTTVGYMGMDLADLATNKIDNKEDMSEAALKDIVKCAVICGAEYLVGSKIYDVIPEANSKNKVLNGALNTARTLGIELSVAFVSEYAQTGEWATYQMNPKDFVKLTLATFAIEELTRMGLSAPAGRKSNYSPTKVNNATAQIVVGRASQELQKQFEKNPSKFMNLKLLEMQKPELFNDLIISTLNGTIQA